MLPGSELGEPGRLDVFGLLLMVAGMPLVVYGLSEVGTTGSFGAPQVVWPIVAGLLLLAVFVRHALRTERPLLDVRLYANRIFGSASLTTFFLGAALFGAMILVPLYYQQVRGESVVLTGLLTGPQGLGMLFVAPFTARLTARFGGGRVALVGVSLLALSTISLALTVRGVGIGLAFMPTMTVSYAALRKDQLSDATPQMNVLQRVGGAIGTALLAVVLQRASAGAQTASELAGAFGTAYWWSLALSAVALVPCVVLLRAEDQLRLRGDAERDAGAIAEVEVEPLGA
jgi:MFS family permease